MSAPATTAILVEPPPVGQLAALLEARPFGLLPLGSEPVLHHTLQLLAGAGIRNVHLFLCHLPARTRAYVGDGARWGLNLRAHSVVDPAGLLDHPQRLARYLGGAGIVLGLDLILSGAELTALVAASAYGTARLVDQSGRGLPGYVIGREGGSKPPGKWLNVRIPSARLIDSPHSFWRANREQFLRTEDLPHIERQIATGLFLGNGSRVHETAELREPCIVGPNSMLGRGAVAGPGALIGRGVIVDEHAEVTESIVLPGSYVGAHSLIRGKIVDGGTVIDIETGEAAYIDDPTMVGTVSQYRLANTSVLQFLEWLLAFAGTCALAVPLALWVIARIASGKRAFVADRRFRPVRRRLNGDVAFEEMVLWSLAGVQRSAWRKAPWLLQVLRNRLRLVGTAELPQQRSASSALLDESFGMLVSDPAVRSGGHASALSLSFGTWLAWIGELAAMQKGEVITDV